jgi:hypothetical protein
MESLRILQPIAQSNRDVISLQATDVLAQQFARYETMRIEGKTDSRRMYIDRLTVKCSFIKHMSVHEVRESYREVKMLESAKQMGRYPKRVMKR